MDHYFYVMPDGSVRIQRVEKGKKPNAPRGGTEYRDMDKAYDKANKILNSKFKKNEKEKSS